MATKIAALLNWKAPRIRLDEEKGQSRKASWLELFFDLFFVVAIGQLAHELGVNISPAGYGVYLVQFMPLFLLWLGFTYYSERFETDGLDHQLATFAMMFPVVGMAVFAHHGLTDNYAAFIAFYAAGRIFTLALWIRAALHNRDSFGGTALRIVGPPAFGIALTLLSTRIDGDVRFFLFALGLLLEIAFPLLRKKQFDGLPRISTSKNHERLALFTIIVLGENVVGIVGGLTTIDHPSATDFYRAAKALVIGCYFWWVYFDSLPHREIVQSPRKIVLWAYLHFPIYVAISGISPAIAGALTLADGENLPINYRLILAISLSTFLVSVALIEILVYDSTGRRRSTLASVIVKIVSAVGVIIASFLPFAADALLACISVPMLLPLVQGAYSKYREVERNNT